MGDRDRYHTDINWSGVINDADRSYCEYSFIIDDFDR